MASKALQRRMAQDKIISSSGVLDENQRVTSAFLKAATSGVIDPDHPVHVIMLDKLQRNAARFHNKFPSGTQHMYAIKANPEPIVLQTLFASGINHFDVASGEEIRLVRQTLGADAVLYYMHPRKSDSDIDIAFASNVKGFVADSKASLEKIVTHPQFNPAHHSVIIRIEVAASENTAMPLDNKFGAIDELRAAELLRICKTMGIADIGISFHVGSQTMHPHAYAVAIDLAASYAQKADVALTSLDVGGGFPAFEAYPHLGAAPDLSFFAKQISIALDKNDLSHVRLITEPGRALVADTAVLINRVIEVDHERGALYINDGTYGNLFDASQQISFDFPTFAFNQAGILNGTDRSFQIQGVTCDSCDKLAGKWSFPEQIINNDFIGFGLHGAYSAAMSTGFNGFGIKKQTLVI